MKKFCLLILVFIVSCSSVPSHEGFWEGNIYTNEGLGVTFTLPNNFEIISEDEIGYFLGSLNIDVEAIDMLVIKEDRTANLVISIEDNRNRSIEEVLEYMSSEINLDGLETEITEGSITLGGTEWTTKRFYVQILEGVSTFEVLFLVSTLGNYLRAITIISTSFSEYSANDLLEFFEDL